MLTKRRNASLDGVNPNFFREIEGLNTTLSETTNFSGQTLQLIGERFGVEGSEFHLRKVLYNTQASDKYRWWCVLVFDNYGDQILMAIPDNKKEGQQPFVPARSIAFYAKGTRHRDIEKQLVKHFVQALKDHQKYNNN